MAFLIGQNVSRVTVRFLANCFFTNNIELKSLLIFITRIWYISDSQNINSTHSGCENSLQLTRACQPITKTSWVVHNQKSKGIINIFWMMEFFVQRCEDKSEYLERRKISILFTSFFFIKREYLKRMKISKPTPPFFFYHTRSLNQLLN